MEDNSNEFSINLVKNFMSLFFNPELEKRKNENILPDKFKLVGAQVIFFPDGTKPIIRFNNEISANAKLKEVVNENGGKRELIEKITLNEKKYENCGHATFIFENAELVHCSFDFHRNKAIVKKHLEAAKEFYKTAKFAFENNLHKAFIDNAFSSMELLAKSELLLSPGTGLEKKSSHNSIKAQYNRRAKNILNESTQNTRIIFNKLSNLRSKARYLKGDYKVDVKDDEIIITMDESIKIIEDIVQY